MNIFRCVALLEFGQRHGSCLDPSRPSIHHRNPTTLLHTEAERQQEVVGKMLNPLLPSLSTLGRRSAGILHLRSRNSHRATADRAVSSTSKRITSKQKPILKPSVIPSPRASEPAGSSLAAGKQSGVGNSRSRQPLPRNSNGRSHTSNQQPATTPIERPTLRRPRTPGMQGSIKNTPEYKSASRKWIASIIALPIFIVTSYFLFDRCRGPLVWPAATAP